MFVSLHDLGQARQTVALRVRGDEGAPYVQNLLLEMHISPCQRSRELLAWARTMNGAKPNRSKRATAIRKVDL